MTDANIAVKVCRLIKPGVFEVAAENVAPAAGTAVIRPTYLSICAADQRYWSGKRDPQALAEKLPMALIHEGVGVVVSDSTGTLEPGTSVVMVPNLPDENDEDKASKENYSRSSRFCSSSADGFMRNLVVMPTERLVPFGSEVDPVAASMSELVSVCLNAVEAFDQVRHVERNERIGIWGDGAVGFLMAAVIRELYPQAHIMLFGTHDSKMDLFDFVDERHNVRRDFKDFPVVDHAFECVGGLDGCTSAIEQIIDCIRPQGVISLMGVSELPVPINTRMVLEKGLTLQGDSRSGKGDFERAVELFSNPVFSERVSRIIARVFEVDSVEAAAEAFHDDGVSRFKTIMHWDNPLD